MALWKESSEALLWESWGGSGGESWSECVSVGGAGSQAGTCWVTGAIHREGASVPAVKVSELGVRLPESPENGQTQKFP